MIFSQFINQLIISFFILNLFMEGQQNNLTIGWIGTGVMGFHMCRHLIEKKYKLVVYNRTPSKAEGLLQMGAEWKTPQQMSKIADILIIMLGYPIDVKNMCLGTNDAPGLLTQMKKGSILIDHTTSQPSLAQLIYQQAKKHGIGSIDAPVSGGDVGAKSGKLVTMCGGDKQDIDRAKIIMDCYSREVRHAGKAGKGQHTKMVNQTILASNMIGVVEGLLYASKVGLDLDETINTISLGAASSVALTGMGRRMVQRDMQPGFYVEHFIKDMGICLSQAEKAKLDLPSLKFVAGLYKQLKDQMNGGRNGTQALLLVLQRKNNYKIN